MVKLYNRTLLMNIGKKTIPLILTYQMALFEVHFLQFGNQNNTHTKDVIHLAEILLGVA